VTTNNKMYVRGRSFEYRVSKFLKGLGWTVFRSAGSHTCADLIAFKYDQKPVLVQCKASSNHGISIKGQSELHALETELGVNILVIGRASNNRFIYYQFPFSMENGRLVITVEPEWLSE
jgi:Holliday junction resolvase